MSEGVEWALHCCVDLSRMRPSQPVTAGRLAKLYDLPIAYLNKQLQALGKAGIVRSAPGPRGGFRLARPQEEISLLDVVIAIEGAQPAFRCTDIVRSGAAGRFAADCGHRSACAVAQAMRAADLVWRKHLAARTVADLREIAELRSPRLGEVIRDWLGGAEVPEQRDRSGRG